MSAIRHLIEAHKAARRAVDYGTDGEPTAGVLRTEDALLRALIAEPARTPDAIAVKARYLLDGCPHATELMCNDAEAMRQFLSAFFLVDPIFNEIERCQTATRKLSEIEGEGPEFDRLSTAQLDAWMRLIQTVPTTMEGMIAFVRFVAAWPDLNHLVGDQGAAEAMRTLAKAFATLDGEAAR